MAVDLKALRAFTDLATDDEFGGPAVLLSMPSDLATGDLEILQPMGEGTAGTMLVRSPKGVLGIFKARHPLKVADTFTYRHRVAKRQRLFRNIGVDPAYGVNREVAVSQLDQELDGPRVVPPAVLRSTKLGEGFVAVFVPGVVTWRDVKAHDEVNESAWLDEFVEDPRARRMAQMDWVLGQVDRHSKNLSFVVLDGTPCLVLIDNELCLGTRPAPVKSGFISKDLTASQVQRMLDLEPEELEAWSDLGSDGLRKILIRNRIEEAACNLACKRLEKLLA